MVRLWSARVHVSSKFPVNSTDHSLEGGVRCCEGDGSRRESASFPASVQSITTITVEEWAKGRDAAAIVLAQFRAC